MGNTQSPLLKSGTRANLVFQNFYFYNKNWERREVSKKDLPSLLKKCTKYIHTNANVDKVAPKGVITKVSKIIYHPKREELECVITLQIKKGVEIKQHEYKKYIEDRENGPFEGPWDDAHGDFRPPTLTFLK
jgi:hypothetical protein